MPVVGERGETPPRQPGPVHAMISRPPLNVPVGPTGFAEAGAASCGLLCANVPEMPHIVDRPTRASSLVERNEFMIGPLDGKIFHKPDSCSRERPACQRDG